jgi:hypothetical protein
MTGLHLIHTAPKQAAKVLEDLHDQADPQTEDLKDLTVGRHLIHSHTKSRKVLQDPLGIGQRKDLQRSPIKAHNSLKTIIMAPRRSQTRSRKTSQIPWYRAILRRPAKIHSIRHIPLSKPSSWLQKDYKTTSMMMTVILHNLNPSNSQILKPSRTTLLLLLIRLTSHPESLLCCSAHAARTSRCCQHSLMLPQNKNILTNMMKHH